jgi:hypothetical protein
MTILKIASLVTGLIALSMILKPKEPVLQSSTSGDEARYDNEDFLADLSE